MQTIKQQIEAVAARKGYLPSKMNYRECADLNGTEARRFLEAAGFEVVENGDKCSHGFALTACGIYLSTNGYCFLLANKS